MELLGIRPYVPVVGKLYLLRMLLVVCQNALRGCANPVANSEPAIVIPSVHFTVALPLSRHYGLSAANRSELP
jgi:hypothetical protein